MTARWKVPALVAALVLVRVLTLVVMLHSGIQHEHTILGGDARRYEQIADGWGTPYRDFDVEYPPVSLALIEAVNGHDELATITRVAWSQLAFELGTAAVLAWAWSQRTAIVYLILGLPMLLFPFPYPRIDLLSVFLAILSMGLLRRNRPRSSGIVLALAIFAKLWPIALTPLPVVERRWKAVVAFAVSSALALAAWGSFAGTSGLAEIATFRGAKGWQIESLPGAIIHMADPGASQMEQGAWRTDVAMPGWGRVMLTAASLAVVVGAWWLANRRRTAGGAEADDAIYGLAPLAGVLSLLIFSPIISPQYILWIVPFVAIVAAFGHRLLGWLGLAVIALTTYILATIHAQIEGHLYATAPIVLRNGLLVVMLAVALYQLARTTSTTADSTPVAPDRPGDEVTANLSA